MQKLLIIFHRCSSDVIVMSHAREPTILTPPVYLSCQLLMQIKVIPAGWQVWAVFEQSQANALAHADGRLACLLFRPDSLLLDTQALQVLREALAFLAAKAGSAADY